jgi:von Willebrand factor type A domain
MRDRSWSIGVMASLLAISCGASTARERLSGPKEDAGPQGDEASSPTEGPVPAPPSSNGFIAPPADASFGNDDAQDPAGCGAESRKAETLSLDMVIMMDRSASMNEPVKGGVKWPLLTSALQTFVEDPASQGIGVSLQYFGIPTADVLGIGMVSCDVAEYAKPDVPMTVLPAAAPAIVASLMAHSPLGATPTVPALEGAIQYAKSWGALHPTHKVVVVLATDGDPNDCTSTIDGVSQVASDGASGTPGIPTYVIGVGELLVDLDRVAQAGGTNHAFIVDTSQNVAQSFLDAMNAIRKAAALPCRYALPSADGGTGQDFDRLNVTYTPGTGPGAGTPSTIPRASGASQCDAARGGWYYDDPASPTAIELCGTTCTAVESDPSGEVDILVGCKTLVIPIH